VDKEKLLIDGRKRRSIQIVNENERHIAVEIEAKERESRILRRARTEDLSAIAKSGCLYRSGQDRLGRQVVVVVGKWFRPDQLDLDRAFLYLVKLLDDINGEYCVIYFHSRTESENRPSYRWMRSVYDNMEYRFKKNLKSFCIVHPTLWTKALTWWFTTFMAPAIKPKIRNVSGLHELFSVIAEPNQLQIPVFISEHDITLNGFRAIAYAHNNSKSNSASPTSSGQSSQLAATPNSLHEI